MLTMITGVFVHTAVLYLHGGDPGLEEKTSDDVSFGRAVWTFRYNSLGLARASASEYLARPEPMAWALAVLMRPDGFPSRAALALACLDRIRSSKDLDEERRFKLLNFVATYVKLDETSSPELEKLLGKAENEEILEMKMTWADEIKEEGREEGRSEAIEKLRDLVCQLVSDRFGSISKRTLQTIAAITSIEELTQLARSVVRVDSLEELKIG